MGGEPLCPSPGWWRLGLVSLVGGHVLLHLEPVRLAAPCPECGVESGRVHSRYRRTASDLSWCGSPVKLVVHSRKLFCDNTACPKRIFAERFPGALDPFARQTERLKSRLLELVHSSNGEMASRMSKLMGFPTSGDTLIRRQRQEMFTPPTPSVLGVDEFALRRGSTYATILVDLKRHQPIDVLEERTSAPLTSWLSTHDGVKVVARDRAEAYAKAATSAAPNAVQVADRFHLVHNIGEAFKELLQSRTWKLPQPPSPPEPARVDSDGPKKRAQRPGPRPTPLKVRTWEEIQKHKGKGLSKSAIARAVGINRKTVRRYLELDAPPVYAERPPRFTRVSSHLPYLRARWMEGCHNARQLYREILQRGSTASARAVRAAVRPWRSAPPQPGAPHPTPLRRLTLPPSSHLDVSEKKELEDVLGLNPQLALGYRLKERFRELVAERNVAALDQWIEEAGASELPTFKSRAKTFRQDYEAVKAALTTPWSTAQVEGQNNRVKLIKRLGYGRAKLDLLRVRILHRIAA